MLAGTAIAGKKYLSKDGTPVKVVGTKGDKVVLKSEATGNEILVSKNYPLQEYDDQKINSESKILLRSNGPCKTGKEQKHKSETLASVIDPLLFAGGKTVEEIVEEIEKKKLSIAKDRDLSANVRARMVNYRRQGYQIEKTEDKKVRIVKLNK